MHVSPVTLDQNVAIEARFVIFTALAVVGNVNNIFLMFSCIRNGIILKAGCFFIFYAGLCDTLISLLITPMTLAGFISKSLDTPTMCHAQYFISSAVTYAYGFLTLANSYEYSHKNQCTTNICGHRTRVSLCAFMLIGLSCTVSAIGVYVELDYDYCEQKHEGDNKFRAATAIGLILLPGIATFFFLIKAFINARVELKEKAKTNRKKKTGKRHYFIIAEENVMPTVNLFSYLFYLIMWLPYVIEIHVHPKGPSTYIHLAVLGLSRSVFAPCLYWCDTNFRRAYSKLFKNIGDTMNCRKEFVNSEEDKKTRNFRLSHLDFDAGEEDYSFGSQVEPEDPL